MTGRRIAHYEVSGKIGSGAMGEVYLGQDTKLDRKVAIKVLIDSFAARRDGLQRFEGEAKLLASLNHPHIATVYGIEEFEGNSAIVMELVEGETLQERLSKGAMTLPEVLTSFRQIARALAAAHERGIIHRDLKPGNIKFSSDGSVKVLDFGLAKAVVAPSESTDLEAPTLPVDTTEPGRVMGTPAYMSPEQTRGLPVDKRTDVWAFGCCLYQALTGSKPFEADTVSDLMAEVLKVEPDFASLPAETPRDLVSILRGCLHKDPRRRLRDLGDIALRLDAIDDADPASIPTSETQQARSRIIALALGSALLAGMAVWFLKPDPSPKSTDSTDSLADSTDGLLPARDAQHVKIATELPPSYSLFYQWGKSIDISPDGSRVAMIGEAPDGTRKLFLRELDDLKAVEITGTEGVYSFDFSPGDGSKIVFLARRGTIRNTTPEIVDLRDRTPKVLKGAGSFFEPLDVSWDEWGIVLGRKLGTVHRIDPESEDSVELTKLGPGEASHRSPQLIHDGTAVLYSAHDGHSRFGSSRIVVRNGESGDIQVVKEGGYDARLLANGTLIYMQNGGLFAAALDRETLEIGRPVQVMDQVFAFGAPAQFNLSDQGTLVYLRGRGDDIYRVHDEPVSPASLKWVSSGGSITPFLPEGYYASFKISPDGLKVAYSTYSDGQADVWYCPIEEPDRRAPLTSNEAQDFHPIWTPDSESVIFSSNRNGQPNIYQMPIKGAPDTEPRQLTVSRNYQVPHDWKPDDSSKLVILESGPDGGEDLVVVDVSTPDGQSEKLFPTPSRFTEYGAQYSPDGAWLAFGSNQSQQHGPLGQFEVYVTPSRAHAPVQVTNLGKDVPSFRPSWLAGDPPRLFFSSVLSDSRHQVQSIEYSVEAGRFVAKDPSPWIGAIYDNALYGPSYDVHPDGSRILIRKAEENSEKGEVTPAIDHFVLFRDFDKHLKELVPE